MVFTITTLRVVDKTAPVRQLHFEELKLAYFGAKILHPTCVQPTKIVEILWNPSAPWYFDF